MSIAKQADKDDRIGQQAGPVSIAKQADNDDQNGQKAGPIHESQSLFGEEHSKEERTSM